MVVLTAEDERVLGCLIEKEAFTPDVYPLTLNALTLACNQSSNRDPVVSYDEATVSGAVEHLRELGLIRIVHSSSYRATKYRHVAAEAWALTSGELAVLAVLLLRGPQTVNELRTRSERYGGDIEELGGIETVLRRLATAKEAPFVHQLPRQPGQREERWMHVLGAQSAGYESETSLQSMTLRTESPRSVPAEEPRSVAETGRSSDLARQIFDLRLELDELRRRVAALEHRFAAGNESPASDAF